MSNAIHDELLDALAEVARGERAAEPEDARWDALAADALCAEDLAALEALAAEDDSTAATFEAFRPIDAGRKAGIVDAMLTELARSNSAAPPDAVPTGAKIIPFRRSFLGRAVTIGVPLALAAGLALFALRPAAVAPVPGYSLEIAGGQQAMRGDTPTGTPPTLAPGVRLELVLSPDTRVRGPGALGVRGFLLRDGQAQPWSPAAEITEAGAVRLAGDLVGLGLADVPPGAYTAVLAVGRVDALPSEAPQADPPPDAGWRRLSTPLVIKAK